jgi:hypothetical protein
LLYFRFSNFCQRFHENFFFGFPFCLEGGGGVDSCLASVIVDTTARRQLIWPRHKTQFVSHCHVCLLVADCYMAVVAAHGLETVLGDAASQEEMVGTCGMYRKAEKCIANCC